MKKAEILQKFFVQFRQRIKQKPRLVVGTTLYMVIVTSLLILLGVFIVIQTQNNNEITYLARKNDDFNAIIIDVEKLQNNSENSNQENNIDSIWKEIGFYANTFVGDDNRNTIVIIKKDLLSNQFGAIISTQEISKLIIAFQKMETTSGKMQLNTSKEKTLYYNSTDGVFTVFGRIPNESYSVYNMSLSVIIIFLILVITLIALSIIFYLKYIRSPFISLNQFVNKLVTGDGKKDNDGLEVYLPLAKEMGIMPDNFSKLLKLEYNSQLLLKQAELDALQSQINPHFLYNTLETIRGLALSKGELDIAKMIKALANFFRYSITRSNTLVPLKEEIQNVLNYFIILQYRFDDRFSFTLSFNEEYDQIMNYKIPKFTLQPIVENGVKHGLENKLGKGVITLGGYETGNMLILTIQDNGIGISFEQLVKIKDQLANFSKRSEESQKTGLALSNVNARLKLTFGMEYGLNIFSTPNVGTRVEIMLPMNINDINQIAE